MDFILPGKYKIKYCYFVLIIILYSSMAVGSLAGVSDSVEAAVVRPHFVDVGPRNVTAVLGQSAWLQCRVKHPGSRTVSWMRKRDLHILTSGTHTYTGDARFSVHHPPHGDDYDLHIQYVQRHDAGVYECQVNTEPKINMAVLLNVEDAVADIWGSADVYVKKGSTISLTCSVNVQSSAASSSVQWFHGRGPVDFDSQRGGISLETEKTDTGTTSRLLVTRARLTDSGNYTCVPSNASPASVHVHVLHELIDRKRQDVYEELNTIEQRMKRNFNKNQTQNEDLKLNELGEPEDVEMEVDTEDVKAEEEATEIPEQTEPIQTDETIQESQDNHPIVEESNVQNEPELHEENIEPDQNTTS